MARLPSIPQLYRNVNRWREILTVLSRFGVAEWVSRLSPGLGRELLSHGPGEDLSHLTHETRVRLALTELGPTAIKLGQVLSTRPDVVGNALAEELEQLRTRTPPTPVEAVRAVIEAELGRPVPELFFELEDEPLASASIAQVHAALLHDGRRVVVKVQHPGIERKVRVDLEILSGLAQLAERLPELRGYRPVALVAELERSLTRELDFGSEERHLNEFLALFEDDATVRIPRPYPRLSTHRVLTMDRLDGISLADRETLLAAGHDLEEVARRGAAVYVEMVFLHGVYHADPHPGNIVVLPGDVVGLLDFGMVGRLDDQLRDDIVDVLLAIAGGDARYLASLIVRVGKVPTDLDHAALQIDVAELMSHYTTQRVGDFDLTGALEDVVSMIRRYHITLPARLSMLIKMLVVLEGSSRLLQPGFSLVEVIRPYQRRLLLRRWAPKRRLLKLRRLTAEIESLFEVLPRNLIDLMERLQSGRFYVHLDHRGLEPSVNRLVWGLITSALFLGASLLMGLEVPPRLHGYSLPGVVGLGVSLVLALRLLRAIAKSGHLDRGRRRSKPR